MDMEFNKNIEKARKILIQKYDMRNPEIFEKLKNEMVKQEMLKKEEFLKGKVSESEQSHIAKERIESVAKTIDTAHTMNFVEKVIDENKDDKGDKGDKSNKSNDNEILDIDDTDTLLKKYEEQMITKYSDKNVIAAVVKNLINIELKSIAGNIRFEIELKYRLQDERDEKKKELSARKKYKNNTDLLERDLDKYINKRKKIIMDGKASGVDPDKQDKDAMSTAEQLWRNINIESKTKAKKWNSLTDKEKLEPYTKEPYKKFYDSYPLIVKYMVYQLQYHPKAFKRFLEKCRRNTANKDASKRKKGEMMEVWQENQAWYVRFLYEEYQKAKNLPVNIKYAQKLFAHTYEKLRKEKKEFQNKFDNTQEKLDIETVENCKEKIKDIIEKLKSGKLSDKAKKSAVELLKQLLEIQGNQQV